MRIQIPHALLIAAALTTAVAGNAAAAEPAGQFDFGTFTPPKSGGQFVEVNLHANLIAMAARLTEKAEPEVAQVLRGLQGVRVNVIGLDDQNRDEIRKRVEEVRADLEKRGWQRIVTARQKEEDVGVYLKTRGQDAIEGIAVVVLDGKHEAVFVNVVGDIKPEQLAMVGDRLNIEPLKKLGAGIPKSSPAPQQ